MNLVVRVFYSNLNILQVFKTFYNKIWAIKKFVRPAFHFKRRLIKIQEEVFSRSIDVLDYVIDTIWKEIKSEGIEKCSSSFKSWVSCLAQKYYRKVQKFLRLLLQLLANEKKSCTFSKPVAYSIVSKSSKYFVFYRHSRFNTIFLLCICIIDIYNIIIISYHWKETFSCVNGRKCYLMKYNVRYKIVSVRLGHISNFNTDLIRYIIKDLV